MKLFVLISTSLFFTVSYSYSQNFEYFDTDKEVLWVINKNSWGGLLGGGVLKFSNKISDNQFKTIGFELVNIKHPKENRYTSSIGYGRTFIWGKKNYLFSLRAQYGRETILFSKKDQQGVRINAQVAAGPSIGLKVPYYIKYSRNNRMYIENFDPSSQTFNNVIGSASFLEGIDELSIKPGINIKAAINFEFSPSKSTTAIEVGFLGDFFPGGVDIMPTAKEYSFYPTAFITLFYGRKY